MRDSLEPINHNGHEDHEGRIKNTFFVSKIFSRENIWAFVLFLILIALIVFTSDSSPVWIYQGF